MRNKCNIVRDLLPLYVEDMVSSDTASYVDEHLRECPSCKTEYESMKTSNAWETLSVKQGDNMKAQKRSFQAVKRKFSLHVQLVSFGVLLIGLIIGLSLTAGMEMFLNALIMPLVGVLGYIVFRWKALYKMPALLLVLDVAINLIAFFFNEDGYMDFTGFALYALIYIAFMCVGVLIAGLLHFAFKKEKK